MSKKIENMIINSIFQICDEEISDIWDDAGKQYFIEDFSVLKSKEDKSAIFIRVKEDGSYTYSEKYLITIKEVLPT